MCALLIQNFQSYLIQPTVVEYFSCQSHRVDMYATCVCAYPLQSQFSDVTPYSVMFGPDMCGGNHKMHLIVTVTDPRTGQRQQRHAPQPDSDLKGYFTDRKSHLYTLRWLHLYPLSTSILWSIWLHTTLAVH